MAQSISEPVEAVGPAAGSGLLEDGFDVLLDAWLDATGCALPPVPDWLLDEHDQDGPPPVEPPVLDLEAMDVLLDPVGGWSVAELCGPDLTTAVGAVAGRLASVDPTDPDVAEATLLALVTGWQRVVDRAQAAQALATAFLYTRRAAVMVEDVLASGKMVCLDSEFNRRTLTAEATARAHEAIDSVLEAGLAWGRRKRATLGATADALTAYPTLAKACLTGELETSKALIIAQGADPLDSPPNRHAVVDALTPVASKMKHARLRSAVAREVAQYDYQAADRRHRKARSERSLEFIPDRHDATADLLLRRMDPREAADAYQRVDTIAKAAKAEGDPRSLDQIRHEVAVSLLLGRDTIAAPDPAIDTPDTDDDVDGAAETGDVDADDLDRDTTEDAPSADRNDRFTSDDGRPGTPFPTRPAGVSLTDLHNRAGLADGPLVGWRPGAKSVTNLVISLNDALALPELFAACGIDPNQTNPGYGDADLPPEYTGYGPIATWLARRLLTNTLNDTTGEASVNVVITHPTTGQASQIHPVDARFIRGPMRTLMNIQWDSCSFPECDRPAVVCDGEHNQPISDGGRTEPGNILPMCEIHHRLKTRGTWKVERLPDGSARWTSPTGNTFHTNPKAYTRPKRTIRADTS